MTVNIGNITLTGLKQDFTSNNDNIADVLVGKSRLFVPAQNLNDVRIYNKNEDGTFGTYVKSVNWHSQNSNIERICNDGSSVPTAYTVFVQNERDYLVGWSKNTNQILVWEIDSNGAVGSSLGYGAPTTMNNYSRAGWDGGHYIYFWKNGVGLYRWDLLDRHRHPQLLHSFTNSSGLDSSYTGNGLYVDEDYMYWGDGSNEDEGLLGCFRRTDGSLVTKVTGSTIGNITPTINGEHGNITINPLHPNIVYYFYISNSHIKVLNATGIKDRRVPIGTYQDTDATEINIAVPSSKVKAGDKLKVRVYAGVKIGGEYVYSSEYTESNVATAINNTAPTTPIISFPQKGYEIDAFEKLTVDWTDATDEDGNDLTYDLEFFNGTEWIVIARKLKQTMFTHTVPNVETTHAYYRVRAHDGYEYGDKGSSNMFKIKAVDLDSLSLPNALVFDGVDDYVEFEKRFIPASGDFTIEFSFKCETARDNMRLLTWGDYSYIQLLYTGQLHFSVNAQGKATGNIRFDNNRLHHCALVRGNGHYMFYVDGKKLLSLTDDNKAFKDDYFEIGKHFSVTKNFKGLISLPRIWATARTQEEIRKYMNKEVPDDSEDIVDIFEKVEFVPTTGQIKGSVTGAVGEIYGGASWGYKFVPIKQGALPQPNNPLRLDNLMYLRAKVNEFRVNNGLEEKTDWTDDHAVALLTNVKAIHMNELLTAIKEAYEIAGEQIKASEINDFLNKEVHTHDPILGRLSYEQQTAIEDSVDAPPENTEDMPDDSIKTDNSSYVVRFMQTHKMASQNKMSWRYYMLLRALFNR